MKKAANDTAHWLYKPRAVSQKRVCLRSPSQEHWMIAECSNTTKSVCIDQANWITSLHWLSPALLLQYVPSTFLGMFPHQVPLRAIISAVIATVWAVQHLYIFMALVAHSCRYLPGTINKQWLISAKRRLIESRGRTRVLKDINMNSISKDLEQNLWSYAKPIQIRYCINPPYACWETCSKQDSGWQKHKRQEGTLK